MKYFYLGTSEVRWLGQANVPLFISHRRLAPRKSFPRALTGWALDSGGFTELSMYGEWRTTARDYNCRFSYCVSDSHSECPTVVQ